MKTAIKNLSFTVSIFFTSSSRQELMCAFVTTVANVWVPAPPLDLECPLECQSVGGFCNTNRGQSNPSWHVKWT